MDAHTEATATTEIADGKPHPGRRMTEEEFVAWDDENTRAEWIDGEVIVMMAASYDHIWIGNLIGSVMRIFAEEHDLGDVFTEGMVRLSPGESIRRRVPDVLFVAKDRRHLFKENHLEGPPDLIVEVVSADSTARDWREKYLEYEQAGVREYWVVDPLARRIEAYSLDEDGTYAQMPEKDDAFHSLVLPGFSLKPAWFFQEPRPKTREVLHELGIA